MQVSVPGNKHTLIQNDIKTTGQGPRLCYVNDP